MKLTAREGMDKEGLPTYDFIIQFSRRDAILISPELLSALNAPAPISEKIATLAIIARMLEEDAEVVRETMYGDPNAPKPVGVLSEGIIKGEVIE